MWYLSVCLSNTYRYKIFRFILWQISIKQRKGWGWLDFLFWCVSKFLYKLIFISVRQQIQIALGNKWICFRHILTSFNGYGIFLPPEPFISFRLMWSTLLWFVKQLHPKFTSSVSRSCPTMNKVIPCCYLNMLIFEMVFFTSIIQNLLCQTTNNDNDYTNWICLWLGLHYKERVGWT